MYQPIPEGALLISRELSHYSKLALIGAFFTWLCNLYLKARFGERLARARGRTAFGSNVGRNKFRALHNCSAIVAENSTLIFCVRVGTGIRGSGLGRAGGAGKVCR
ncbi:hypothetical protein FPP74_09450 [Corynebacterium sp. NML180780]|nr:hypothetical protein FPP74_09450 [Corynebacterium sp. NML180780]